MLGPYATGDFSDYLSRKLDEPPAYTDHDPILAALDGMVARVLRLIAASDPNFTPNPCDMFDMQRRH